MAADQGLELADDMLDFVIEQMAAHDSIAVSYTHLTLPTKA